jgi:hypothetical protein
MKDGKRGFMNPRALETHKSEYRISKSETNSNDQSTKLKRKGVMDSRARDFGMWILDCGMRVEKNFWDCRNMI